MLRRDFLYGTAVGSVLASNFSIANIPIQAQAMPSMQIESQENDNILVIVQLFGGNDGLNTIVPAENDQYYNKFRTKVNVAKNQAIRLGNSDTFMNQNLKSGISNGMFGMYNEGNLAVIQGVGYDNHNLSHFRSTDIWLSAKIPVNDSERLETGWMGRYFEKLLQNGIPNDPYCMNIGSSSSLLFQTPKADISISVENPEEFYDRGKDILSGENPMAGSGMYESEFNFLYDISLQSNKYSQVVKKAFDAGKNTTKFETDKLSKQLQLVSRLISGGLKTKVYLVSIDGFDNHANQGSENGVHGNLLKNLSNAVSSFMADLKAQKKHENVLGITVSEFGRRPNDNASYGTDHGAASVMFAFGQPVNGKIFGQNLSFTNLNKNADFKNQFDYRQVYDEIMNKWFKTDDATTKDLLSGRFSLIETGILGKIITATEVLEEEKSLIYPNPSIDGKITLALNFKQNTKVSIEQYGLNGQNYGILCSQTLPQGRAKIQIELLGGAGVYLLNVIKNEQKETLKVLRL